MTLSAIRKRAERYEQRQPSPTVMARVSDQLHRDVVALLEEIDRLKAKQ